MHIFIYFEKPCSVPMKKPKIYFPLRAPESKRVLLMKVIKCGRKVNAHILKLVALSQSPLPHTWACQMLPYAWDCHPTQKGLLGKVRIHMLQDAAGVTGFQWETGTKQHSQKTPEIHYCYLLSEQHDFEMKAKAGPHCFIIYLWSYTREELFRVKRKIYSTWQLNLYKFVLRNGLGGSQFRVNLHHKV